MEILLTIFVLAILLLFVLVVAIIISVNRSRRSRKNESGHRAYSGEEGAPSFGFGGAVATAGETGGWTSESSTSETGREASETVTSRLLLVLDKYRAMPIEELELRVGASREEIVKALHELERKGFVRVEGGMLIFSERGEKLITKLREKYFDKRRWLESI
ncbi:hypothetical protein Pyrde_1203 [Pyrodictium delaneyi]|uniref:Uncharacterized protein n=1 Tax=Pyrodictium delaneyi TaxID=1273541 RepID=A0A0P0N3T1_9CREN|nr:hypothetical protein [Pyrodictium delaneyi]ALL01251.1 hypothetical protein Pyrde_1203 [Pyrodictium delaneyi]OWJ55675.1 hypothetical protein Pdsh_02525 [Pyrodictium delaneyi]